MGRLAVIPPYAANVSAQSLREHPRWARSVIAYKLLMMMIPWPLSKRLWAILIRAGILPPPATPSGPGPTVTTNPDGTTTVTTTNQDGTTTTTTIAPDGTITSTNKAPDGTTTIETTTPDGTTKTTITNPDGTSTTKVTPPPAPPPAPQPTPPAPRTPAPAPGPIYVKPWGPGPPHPPLMFGGKKAVIIDIYDDSRDGYVYKSANTWQDAHDAAFGDAKNTTGCCPEDAISTFLGAEGNYWIYRTFLFINMSSVPTDADIIAAKLKFYGYEATGHYICIQQAYIADELLRNAFGRCYGPLLAPPIQYHDYYWGPEPRNVFEFNADGLAYLTSVLGGTAKLAIREYDHDYLNTPPPAGTNDYRSGFYFAETGGNFVPYLEITYK